MRRLTAAVIWGVVTLWLLIIFVPKTELYFLGERLAEPLKVVYSGETPRDLGLLFEVRGGTLYYENMALTRPEAIGLLTTLFYNRLWIAPLELSPEAAALFPAKINRLEAWHTVFWPHVVFLGGEGDFGSFSGEADLFKRTLRITVQSPAEVQNRYRQLFMMMQPTEEGHRYELAF